MKKCLDGSEHMLSSYSSIIFWTSSFAAYMAKMVEMLTIFKWTSDV